MLVTLCEPFNFQDEFIALVEYIEYKLLKFDNKELEAQWWQDREKKIAQYPKKKMHDFDGIVAPKVQQRKWGKLVAILDIFTIIPLL